VERLWRRIGSRRVIVTLACFVAWGGMGQIMVWPVAHAGLLIGVDNPAYSVVAMGVQPYIYTVILFTVVRACSRTVRKLSDDAAGRLRLERWIRAATILLAAGQAYGLTALFQVDSWFPQIDAFPRLALTAELTAGTMALVLLADILDEHGVGCGYGVYLIYVAGFLPRQMAVIGDFMHYASSSGDRSGYQPLEIWFGLVIFLITMSVAVLRSQRVVPLVRKRQAAELRVPLLVSGVMRPALLANAVMTIPVLPAQYSHSEVTQWIQQNWTAYGPNPWTDVAYTLLHVAVVLGLTCFVVYVDFDPDLIGRRLRDAHLSIAGLAAEVDAARFLRATALRLAFASGILLGVVFGVVPVVTRFFTEGPFHNGPSVSGTLIMLVSAVILAIAAGLQKRPAGVLSLAPRVP
jgi:preprotein translocase subunit SecY